jgi:hypothetical protein
MMDAFWSREETNIKVTHGSIQSAIKKTDMMNRYKLFPALGSLPLRNYDGMGVVALQLLKTLDPGISESLVQYYMAKKYDYGPRRNVGSVGAQ